jgi:NAD(P)-dependent dehydrogenase (short-subunit alcohol dehydrogenase family)
LARTGGRRGNGGQELGLDVETAKQQVVASQGGFATGRFTRPDEVADLVLFLASERSGNITKTTP